MSEYKKQLPEINATNKEFWDAAKRHELKGYRCLNCGTFYSFPIDCVACDNPKMEWVKVSGKGQIFTYAIYHQAFHPTWKDEIPYNVTWVKLDEGPLIMCNVVQCKNEELYVKMPVEVVFDDVTEEVTLPKFKPVK